jgi:hypothetical protein
MSSMLHNLVIKCNVIVLVYAMDPSKREGRVLLHVCMYVCMIFHGLTWNAALGFDIDIPPP